MFGLLPCDSHHPDLWLLVWPWSETATVLGYWLFSCPHVLRNNYSVTPFKGASLLRLCFVQEGLLFKTNHLKVLAFSKYVLAKKVHFQINPLKVLAFSKYVLAKKVHLQINPLKVLAFWKYVLSKKASFSNKSFKRANLLTICFVQEGQLSSKTKTKSDQKQKL